MFKAFFIDEIYDFVASWILYGVLGKLSKNDINILASSAYSMDYIFILEPDFERVLEILNMIEVIFFKGFFLSLSLIVAIGAQNIFILKQAINQNYIFSVCILCFLCDVLLMNLGIFGVGELLAKNRFINIGLAISGICFTLYYAFLSLKSIFTKHSSINIQKGQSLSYKKTILLTLAITLFNPQVYLDTIFLIGAAAVTFNIQEKILFVFGALSASFIWFFSLGYGAKKFSFWLKKPSIAIFIDIFVAFVMLMVAYSLFLYVLENI